MSALVVSFIVFACVLGGAALGMFTRSLLPDHHVNEDSKYIFKLGIGLIATLAALVLGLLIASAKSSYDAKQDEVKQGAAKIILLDRTLRHYGPEADPARAILRRLLASKTALTWMKSDMDVGVRPGDVSPGIEEVQEKLRVLVPASEGQRWLQTRGLQLSSELAQMRWLSIDQHSGSIPTPFLVALVFWLAVIFCSFGLFAPRHLTVYAVIFACALSVSSAIFLHLGARQTLRGLACDLRCVAARCDRRVEPVGYRTGAGAGEAGGPPKRSSLAMSTDPSSPPRHKECQNCSDY